MQMKQKVDLRGLTCPEPVLRTKKLFDDQSVDCVEALVDDDVCVNNLQRLARSLKAVSTVKEKDGFYLVDINRGASGAQAPEPDYQTSSRSIPELADKAKLTVIFLSKDTFGQGEPEFSRNLINLFLQTVLEAGHQPRAILLANTGVKLMAPDSPALKVLQDFKARGCEVLACGLCVEFYGLKDVVAKEQITNMYAITEYLFAADKVLTP
jgi:selenium metabolism protein YedF